MAQTRKKILIIGDNTGSLLSLNALIAELFSGFKIYTAANGKVGIEVAKTRYPDVILIDIHIVDSFTVCKSLKTDEDLCGIPVVFITPLKEKKENKVRALESGAEGFLTKPFDKTDLLAQIKSMIKIKEVNKSENQRLEKMLAEKTKELKKELRLNNEMRKRLSESEERFQIAQDLSPDGFTILHPLRNKKGDVIDFTWVYENKAVARINGTNPDEVKGKSLLELFPNHKGTSVFEALLLAANTGKTQILKEVYVGEILSVPTWLRLVIVSIGEDIAIHAQNITQQIQTKEALLKSEEKYRTLFHKLSEGIYIHNLEGRVLEVNDMACRQSGYTREEWLGLTVFDGQTNDKLDMTRTDILLTWSKWVPGQRFVFQSEHRRKDGTVYPVEVSTGIVSYGNENVVLAIVKDITDRKKAEEELQKSERNYREIFNSTTEAIFVYDAKSGAILDANESGLRLYGYSHDEVLSLTLRDFSLDVSPYSMKEAKKLLREVFKDGTQTFEWKSRKKNGDIFWAEVSLKNVNINGQSRILSVVRDISKRKFAEEAHEASNKMFSLFIKNSPIYAYLKQVTQNESRVLFASENFYDMVGVPGSQLTGKKMEELYPLEFARKISKDDWDVVSKGEVLKIDENLNDRDYTTIKFPIAISGKNYLAGYTIDITESKKTEEQVRTKAQEQEWLLRSMMNAFVIFKSVFNQNGQFISYRFEYINDAYERITGVKREEVYGKTIHEVWPDTESSWIELYGNVAVSGVPIIFDMYHKATDKLYHCNVYRPWESNDRFCVIFEDITEKNKAEKELLKAKEKAERNEISLIEAQTVSKVGSWETDLSNLNVIWSEETYKIFELNSAIFYPDHNSFLEFVHPEDRQNVNEAFSNSYNKDDYNKIEHRIITALGNIKYVEERWRVIKDNQGNPVKAYGTCQDITDRKNIEIELFKAKEEAEENGRKLEAAHEIAKLGSWELDIRTGIFTFTDSFYSMFHTSAKDMGGYQMSIEDYANRFVHPDDSSSVAHETQLAIESKDPYFTKYIEHRILYFDGGIGYISVKIFIVKDEFGNTIKTFGVNQDITEKKIAEVELIKAKEKAEQSDMLKSAFLANMSHEIRTPMNGILGFAELLKEPDLTGDEQQEYIELINKSGKRMLNIINDIIDISKIEAGLMKLNLTQSNISEQIEYIYTFFKPEAEANGLKLFVKNSLPNKEEMLNTDREKLYAVLTNLVKNAIKFTRKGEIEISCTHKGGFLEFYVKDTGIGIPKDRQHAIFERFIQADIEDRMAFQGAGLGLSISKAYLKMLGGKIWVESEEGKGSTFYFTLPYDINKKQEYVEQVPADYENKKNIRNLNILLVEDDEVSEILLNKSIKSISKEVFKANTGAEAVDIVRANQYIDLILMDIRLPEMGGYEAVRQIRQFNKNVVIIAQTAFGLSGDKEKAIEAGCNDYISKPIDKVELLNLIHKYFSE
ncbi:MAG: PAS domain S-box protein [Ignavibacteria bacterium]